MKVKYGNITNFELIEYARKMKIPLNDVLMRDELNEHNIRPGYYILNLQSSDESGSHWVSFIYKTDTMYYIDSFGVEAVQDIIDLADRMDIKNFYWNEDDYQHINSENCGIYCLALFHYIENNKGTLKKKINDFMNIFFKSTEKNDKVLRRYITSIKV